MTRSSDSPPASSAAARRVMVGNRADSSTEQALRRVLHARGLRFRKHQTVVPRLRCRPDVVFTRWKVAVFVDGCFWDRCPLHGTEPKANSGWWREKLDANVARDRRNNAALERAGWSVVRLWEHQPVEEMADLVGQTLAARGRVSTQDGPMT